jgi:hypothetical protein
LRQGTSKRRVHPIGGAGPQGDEEMNNDMMAILDKAIANSGDNAELISAVAAIADLVEAVTIQVNDHRTANIVTNKRRVRDALDRIA